jgi:hypothetical protein
MPPDKRVKAVKRITALWKSIMKEVRECADSDTEKEDWYVNLRALLVLRRTGLVRGMSWSMAQEELCPDSDTDKEVAKCHQLPESPGGCLRGPPTHHTGRPVKPFGHRSGHEKTVS